MKNVYGQLFPKNRLLAALLRPKAIQSATCRTEGVDLMDPTLLGGGEGASHKTAARTTGAPLTTHASSAISLFHGSEGIPL